MLKNPSDTTNKTNDKFWLQVSEIYSLIITYGSHVFCYFFQISMKITQILILAAHTFNSKILIYYCVQVYAKYPSLEYNIYRITTKSYLKVHS